MPCLEYEHLPMATGLLLICLVLAFFTPGPLFAQQTPPVGPTPGATPTLLPAVPLRGATAVTPVRGATTGNPFTTPTVGVSSGNNVAPASLPAAPAGSA